jgi:hypothetical protein
VSRRGAAAAAALALAAAAPVAAAGAAPLARETARSPAVVAFAKRYQAFRTVWNPRTAAAQRTLDAAVNSARFPAIRSAFSAYTRLLRANRAAYLRLAPPRAILPEFTALDTAVARLAAVTAKGARVTDNLGLVGALGAMRTRLEAASDASFALRRRVGIRS